jgi:hypothetical protein
MKAMQLVTLLLWLLFLEATLLLPPLPLLEHS